MRRPHALAEPSLPGIAHSGMLEEPGRMLRRVRERLRLKYRDVQEATQAIASRHGNQDFSVGLSRLADIENRGTIPSVYRLYSLSAVYGLDFKAVLRWFGVDLNQFPAEAMRASGGSTRLLEVGTPDGLAVELPELSPTLDIRRTSFLSRNVRKWGTLPVSLLAGLDIRENRYALIGTDDWSMYPVLRPGSFVHVDEGRRKPTRDVYTHELERPIYLVEMREGFRCAWCTQEGAALTLQYHPIAQTPAEILSCPSEAEIVGQVVGVAMRLDQVRRRHTRF